ncbi:MAG TPA: RIP metalloprotease RseP [Chthoniobacterales bacterium]|jgi:regulator of sigma E protease
MISHIARVALLVIEVVVLFNLLIAVHELGHFLAAKWRGLFIEQFGIWFGKPIWQKKINGVLYSVGSIPAGGFVKLPQLAPMDIIEGEADVDRAQLPPISALDKIIVAIAGPVFSVFLAMVFACIVWAVGRPVGESDVTTVIGYVIPGSSAEKVGLQPGDKILAVDGHEVTRFTGMNDSVSWSVVRSEGDTVPVEFERDDKTRTVQVVPYKAETRGWRRQSTRQLLIMPAETAIIEKVEANSPAAGAGLRPHDIVAGFNHQKIYSPIALAEYIDKHPKEKLTLEVQRGDQSLSVPVQPKLLPTEGEMKPRIGIAWDTSGRTFIAHTNPFEQVYNSVTGTLETIGAVASPKSDVKFQHMSGPIGIGHVYYMLFENERGWQLALWFSVILNVNLAILNMLPIPVLDGGHIVLAILESIRRKPINIRILEYVQTACAFVIIGYICYVSFFDIGDFFGAKRDQALPKPTPAAAPGH